MKRGHGSLGRNLCTLFFCMLVTLNCRVVSAGEDVILPEKDIEGAFIPCERIRTAIENHDFRINGQRVPITVSLGICSFPAYARDKTELIVRADTALYYSKGGGRNRSTRFSPEMKPEDIANLKKPKAMEQLITPNTRP